MWGAIAAAALPIIAGQLGSNKASQSQKDAQRIIDEAAERYKGLNVPGIDQLQYDPAMQEYAGDIDPSLLASIPGIESEMGGISTDPRFSQAQYESLGALDNIVNSGGMTAMDKLNFQKAQDQAAQASSQQQGNITRDLAERGIGGGGAEIARRMMSAQGAANNSSEAAQTMAATAQQRALEAIMQRGTAAGQMQSQDFNQKSSVATAKDAIAKWNAEQALGINKANQTAINTSQAVNQGARQGVLAGNQNATNAGAQYNAGAVGTQFDMERAKAAGVAGAATSQAATRTAQAGQTANTYNDYGKAAAGLGQAAGNAYDNYAQGQMTGEELDAQKKQRGY